MVNPVLKMRPHLVTSSVASYKEAPPPPDENVYNNIVDERFVRDFTTLNMKEKR